MFSLPLCIFAKVCFVLGTVASCKHWRDWDYHVPKEDTQVRVVLVLH
jgi:hypothetical protein